MKFARHLRCVWAAFTLACAGFVGAQTVDVVLTNGLVEPHSLAVDSSGSLYITDGGGIFGGAHRVMKFVPSTGSLTLLAGDLAGGRGTNENLTPNAGFTARFYGPAGIVLARGGLVVADSANHTIRYVGFDGVVTNIAGSGDPTISGPADGAGAAARFNTPLGLAVDTNGILYVADSKNNAIRRIDAANNVTTLPVAGLNQPNGVAVGDNGMLWVADTLNNQIKTIDTNNVVTVRAGTGVSGSADTFPVALSAQLSSPRGLVWMGASAGLLITDSGNHTLRRLYTNTSISTYSIETSVGSPGQVGLVNGATNTARFNSPIGLAADTANGAYLVVDSGNRAIRRVQQTPAQPPIANPSIGVITLVTNLSTGTVTPVFTAITDGVFNNDAIIAVTAEANVSTLLSSGATPVDPFNDTVPAPSTTVTTYTLNSPAPQSLVAPLPDLTIKAQSIAGGRISSGVVKARFQFVTSSPQITGNNAASFTISNATVGAQIYYTTNGVDPTNVVSSSNFLTTSGTLNLGPISSDLVFKARAFKTSYSPSFTVSTTFSPSNFVANTISFGFQNGEGSSQFIAAAGQTNYSPVVLTLLPGQKMYTLQFGLSVSNLAAPALSSTNSLVAFQSRLLNKNNTTPVTYSIIPPLSLTPTGGFTNLLFTNNNLIGVGWVTQPPDTNYYNTIGQDLIKYSAVHNTLFDSGGGQVIVGAFGFVVPTNGVTNGSTYGINILRPSATSDGIKDDVYIANPTNGALLASQTVTIGSPAYLVGDAVPFRWFNAPDFGDTNLLANDVAQVFAAVVFPGFFNVPLPGSDFADAMDSCCGTGTNDPPTGLLRRDTNYTGSVSLGSETNINFIAFGDGTLDVADLFVTFRRSLDASLTNFMRFRSNGVQYAFASSNSFRGLVGQSVAGAPAPAPRSGRSAQALGILGDPTSVVFTAGESVAGAGQTLKIPITARVTGVTPLRVLALNLNVVPLEGSPALTVPVQFVPDPAVGTPSMSEAHGSAFGAAWLNNAVAGLSGDAAVGTLIITLPAGADANAAYAVRFDHASASPAGIGTVPARVEAGLITTRARTASSWNDGIPDAWRLKHFGTLSNLLSAASADADGDGIPNWAEFRAGTNPNDATSALALRAPGLLSGGPRLRWPTAPGKTYLLEVSPALGGTNWTAIATNILGDGREVEFQTPRPTGPQFFRVRLVEP